MTDAPGVIGETRPAGSSHKPDASEIQGTVAGRGASKIGAECDDGSRMLGWRRAKEKSDEPCSSDAPRVSLGPTSPTHSRLWAWSVGGDSCRAAVLATFLHLAVPEPTGAHAVGRERLSWVDADRPETHTAGLSDVRHVLVQIWYPAVPNTGTLGSYVPDLAALTSSLVDSGEFGVAEAWGLKWVRHHSFDDAEVAPSAEPYPIVVISPGNATNVASYASIAEELASRGYVVVGVDHPYQVAAVQLPDGSVASYDASWDSPGVGVEKKIEERVADVSFVLERLAIEASVVQGRLDFERVAVIGHSNGGLTAMEACRSSTAIVACVNLDGQAAGGPFSTDVTSAAPDQPFLFLTKETSIHPEIHRRFEAAGEGAYRVVVPDAAHSDFADGSLFEPSLNPGVRTEDRVVEVIRGFLAAFLDKELKGASADVLSTVPARTDVYVNIYPLGVHAPIPTVGEGSESSVASTR